MNTFSATRFEQYLQTAAAALDDAIDELNLSTPGDIASPGAEYLLAKLDVAQTLIEAELPSMKKAALIAAAAA